ncbi:DUF4376 domain-containing protein [Methylobacterium sp. E-066]|uniref:DUF4376 domain-containing protein n=1 Tax=Methylobacterium sp. E-066 TaxID=2836584 RepID=UPI001FBA43E9|nr:DUF4376 domain-containing protein [Methylobacterium sp. E-066]MCJ2141864.1 DUF4376 domain-containing protein [Methylobacterium sp. E-066]
MQLYCKPVDGVLFVLAVHVDGDTTPLGAYPGATVVLPYAGEARPADLLGKPVPDFDLADYAAAKRYAVETGGITVSGARVRTDRESQALLTGAYVRAQKNPAGTVSFKTLDGFVKLPAAQVIALGDAVGDHVQACFDAEEAVDAALSAAPPTITALDQVDAAFASLAG